MGWGLFCVVGQFSQGHLCVHRTSGKDISRCILGRSHKDIYVCMIHLVRRVLCAVCVCTKLCANFQICV